MSENFSIFVEGFGSEILVKWWGNSLSQEKNFHLDFLSGTRSFYQLNHDASLEESKITLFLCVKELSPWIKQKLLLSADGHIVIGGFFRNHGQPIENMLRLRSLSQVLERENVEELADEQTQELDETSIKGPTLVFLNSFIGGSIQSYLSRERERFFFLSRLQYLTQHIKTQVTKLGPMISVPSNYIPLLSYYSSPLSFPLMSEEEVQRTIFRYESRFISFDLTTSLTNDTFTLNTVTKNHNEVQEQSSETSAQSGELEVESVNKETECEATSQVIVNEIFHLVERIKGQRTQVLGLKDIKERFRRDLKL